jgi:hypothetical protein
VRLRLAFCLVYLATPLWAGSHNHPAKQADPTEPGYVFALAAATQFLHAWQTGDLENGTILLSDGLRHSENADRLEQFFSIGTERSFEITRGHGHEGRYIFPVILVSLQGSRVARKSSQIILVETGKNDWVVDRLP